MIGVLPLYTGRSRAL